MTLPLSCVVPPALVVKELAATVELKSVVPVEFTVSALAPPATVDIKLVSPEPELVTSEAPSAVAELNAILPLAAVTVPAL